MHNVKYFFISIFFAFLFTFTACDNLLIPYLEVNEVKIENSTVVIKLSAEPNQNKFLNAFGFYEDDISVAGEYSFSSNTVVFTPHKTIAAGHDYSVEISTDLEDVKGHSLAHSFLYKYSTKTESETPYIVSVTPQNETEIRDKDYVPRITFSESVDRKSFTEAFSIVPSISYLLKWADDSSYVDILFEKELSKNTQYTMTITTTLKDLQNNKLRKEYKTNFYYYVPQDSEKDFTYNFTYSYENSAAQQMSRDGLNELADDVIFQIDFSNCVSEDTISSYVSSYPSLKFNFTPDWETSKSVKFTLNEIPQWNREYLFTVKKNITDEFSQTIEESVNYHVIFNHEKDRPVEYVKSFFLRSGMSPSDSSKYFEIYQDNLYRDLNIFIENGGTDQTESLEKQLCMYTVFRISNEASGIDVPSFLKGVQISPTNSCVNIMITNCHFLTASEYAASPVGSLSLSDDDTSGWNLVYAKFDLTVTIYASSGLIRFNFDDSISDSLGNTMNEGLVFTYNKS